MNASHFSRASGMRLPGKATVLQPIMTVEIAVPEEYQVPFLHSSFTMSAFFTPLHIRALWSATSTSAADLCWTLRPRKDMPSL